VFSFGFKFPVAGEVRKTTVLNLSWIRTYYLSARNRWKSFTSLERILLMAITFLVTIMALVLPALISAYVDLKTNQQVVMMTFFNNRLFQLLRHKFFKNHCHNKKINCCWLLYITITTVNSYRKCVYCTWRRTSEVMRLYVPKMNPTVGL